MVAIRNGNGLLGVGIYSPSEAALYARVQTSLINRWVHGDSRGRAVIHSQIMDDKCVSFLDFVQALAIRSVRRQFKIPLQTIREAVNRARKRYGVKYPLAMEHKTFAFGKDLVILLLNDDGEEQLVQLTGRTNGQIMLKQGTELYMKDVHFGSTGEAINYRIFKHDRSEIVMDPQFRFGHPMVTACGYSAEVLHAAVESEGSTSAAAKAFGVSESDIEVVERFYDHLQGPVAA